MEPITFFQKRIDSLGADIAKTEQGLDRIALLRLGLFAGAITGIIISWGSPEISWPLAGVSLVIFGWLVKKNLALLSRKTYLEIQVSINEEELARLAGKLEGLDEGTEFASDEHLYSNDLDLFGRHSIFQLVSRATTGFGRKRLASWLLEPGKPEAIRARQEAIRHLAEASVWRQEFQALGRQFQDSGEQASDLKDWMEEKPLLSGHAWYRWVPWVLSIITTAIIVLFFVGILPYFVPLIMLGVHALVNRQVLRQGDEVFLRLDKRIRLLRSYTGLIGKFEAENWSSPFLEGMKGRLKHEGRPAREELKRLEVIMRRLEFRLNALPWFVMNLLFFYDIFWILRLEDWKGRHGTKVLDWFEVVGEAEALGSLAALHYANPDWNFPEINEGDWVLKATEAAHPLILSDGRVSNPIHLDGKGYALLITGSNMSGKSTYLRTVGINVVLALAGGPVCAKSLEVSPFQVATSMRTLDSIEESTSSFYAELKRLKKVLDSVKAGVPVLFLLDEILKGTNSQDRNTGAQALVRQLVSLGATGLISTHDLELASLEAELPGKVKNFSFHCEVQSGGKLFFDYALREGVCQSMNATELMRSIGISL